MHSAIYTGLVTHARHLPVPHAFRYRLFMMYLDLDELPRLFQGRWLWSADRPALAWFRRGDHLGEPGEPLAVSVRNLVQERSGSRPEGPVRLLTHLRYFGYCMNPVSFYYCRDKQDQVTEFIVAEVNNTPWGERHCYVLDCRDPDARAGQLYSFRLNKEFHVSPFMPMEQLFDWRLGEPADDLKVHMVNYENDRKVFNADLFLKRQQITGPSLAKVLTSFPFMTLKVIGAIYWQAFRLWLKKAPFYSHPKHYQGKEINP